MSRMFIFEVSDADDSLSDQEAWEAAKQELFDNLANSREEPAYMIKGDSACCYYSDKINNLRDANGAFFQDDLFEEVEEEES